MSSDGADVTSGGRLFQTWGPATGKALSPTVDRLDCGMDGTPELQALYFYVFQKLSKRGWRVLMLVHLEKAGELFVQADVICVSQL